MSLNKKRLNVKIQDTVGCSQASANRLIDLLQSEYGLKIPSDLEEPTSVAKGIPSQSNGVQGADNGTVVGKIVPSEPVPLSTETIEEQLGQVD